MAHETFRTRFGLLVSLLGMAVGTGNIWRFPRVMAQNGGGAFLIPWFLFLFLWSIPLLSVEFALGQKLRKGVAGCFAALTGGRFAWLGAFVVLCTLGIMFYYSVVTGWCLYYLTASVTGNLFQSEPRLLWETFNQSGKWPLAFHILSMLLAAAILFRGIREGVESANAVMFPILFLIMMFLAGYALTLPGREEGLKFIFRVDWTRLRDYRVWLEALTQSAWSTGAGWGIALTYACYARSHDHPVLTTVTTGLGNNSVELFAGLAILPVLFSFFPLPDALDLTRRGNTGLTFISLPGLFQKMAGGRVAAFLFFTALFFAALTSLFSMLELGVYFLKDLGWERKKAVILLTLVGIFIGAPSALSSSFLDNQDWVWGIGLLVSGFFFTLLMRQVGLERFSRDLIPLDSGFHRVVFKLLIFWLIPVEFLFLVGWWFQQAVRWDPAGWWNPLHGLSVGTCLAQWGILLGLLLLLNRWMSGKMEVTR